jgi:hypothetical protein
MRMVLTVSLCCACSSSPPEPAIVPEELRVMALPGGNGVLEVSALTLRKAETRTELLAALRNTGQQPACHAAFAVELFDAADQSLAAGITGLLSQHFYRRTDGSETIAACIAPGERTLAAITDLPSELAVQDVRSIVYRTPYFALDVEPIAGLRVEQLEAGLTYKGVLKNALHVGVDKPSVTIFPINRVGRPLGVVLSTSDGHLPPGGEWAFETTPLATPADDFLAFPAGALSVTGDGSASGTSSSRL